MSKVKHPEIFDWSIKRSGAHMTVTGKDVDGRDILLTKVTRVGSGLVFAENAVIHRLVDGPEATIQLTATQEMVVLALALVDAFDTVTDGWDEDRPALQWAKAWADSERINFPAALLAIARGRAEASAFAASNPEA